MFWSHYTSSDSCQKQKTVYLIGPSPVGYQLRRDEKKSRGIEACISWACAYDECIRFAPDEPFASQDYRGHCIGVIK